jgi:hypothetical protein
MPDWQLFVGSFGCFCKLMKCIFSVEIVYFVDGMFALA